MDPHPSQNNAGPQHAVLQQQQEVTRPKARFKPTLPQKSAVDRGAIFQFPFLPRDQYYNCSTIVNLDSRFVISTIFQSLNTYGHSLRRQISNIIGLGIRLRVSSKLRILQTFHSQDRSDAWRDSRYRFDLVDLLTLGSPKIA